MAAVLLISALLIGCLLAVQASVNLQLNKAVGTPYGASTLQLWFAVVLLAALAAAAGAFGALAGIADVPAWYLLGGLASPLYITSAILLFPRLGALAAGGLLVTGQMLASVGLDVFGLFGLPRQPVTVGMAVGAVAVLAGITLVVHGQQPVRVPAAAPVKGGPGAGSPPTPTHLAHRAAAGWLLLGLVAGAVLPVQGAINARLRSVIEQPIAVALVSFIVAAITISLVLAALLVTRRTARPRLPGTGMPWWGWLGGACAAGFVTGTFLLIPAIGAAVTVALTVTGQQLASAAIDSRGWFRLPRRAFTAQRGTGLVLLIAGSLLIQLI
jgi:bacterial/archaeal transporter family-2 protein